MTATSSSVMTTSRRISRIVICMVALATTAAHGGSDDDPLLLGGIPDAGKVVKIEGTGDNGMGLRGVAGYTHGSEPVLGGGADSPNTTGKIRQPGDQSDDSDPLLLGGVPGLK
jgi:hypothetical protein